MSTLVQLLQQKAESVGDNAAFIFRDRNYGRQELSWRTMYRLGGHFAAVLNRGGLGRGDLVINTLPNSPERVVCEAGIWLSGTGSVNGECHLTDGSDLLNTIRVSRASAILVDPDVQNSPWNALKDLLTVGEHDDVTSSVLTDLKKIFFVRRVQGQGQGDFITQLGKEVDWSKADVTPEDIMTVFTTSGTTGFSKLVVYTHGDYIRGKSTFRQLSEEPGIAYNHGPLGSMVSYPGIVFVHGVVRVFCDLRAGSPTNIAEFIWKCIQEEKCDTSFFPTAYLPAVAQLARDQHDICRKEAQSTGVRKLDHYVLTGLPVTRKMVDVALTISHKVISCYGSTECSVVSGITLADSENYVDYDSGPPFKGVSVKIVRPDDESQVLGVNQTGNILIKKHKVNQGYLNNDKANAEAFTEDGFFRTGDTGRMDDRGHLIVEGRSHDAIMRGSYIFYPAWLENRIRACPGVADVFVVGVPDPFLHEELCACILLKSEAITMDDVRQFVEKDVVTSEDNPLSPRPRYYLPFRSFPRTDTGKPRRKEIKAEATERLGTSKKLC